MYAIKNAILLKQAYPDMDITVYYIDIRTPSKGYEEFYDRARKMDIHFTQGRPSLITEDPETRNLSSSFTPRTWLWGVSPSASTTW